MVQTAERVIDKSLYKFEKLHRVVVTGIGAISPLGLNMEETWQALIEGKSGIERISKEINGERVGAINSQVDIAGQVKDFDPKKYIPQKAFKALNKMHRVAQFSTVASIEALTQAGLLETPFQQFKDGNPLINVDPERIGARFGTGLGGGDRIADMEDTIRDKTDQDIKPSTLLQLLAERVATAPSILLNLKAEVAVTTAACASSAIAITDAFGVVQHGRADVMLSGGAESVIHRVGLSAFNNMGALSRRNDDPEGASRPFDKDASGFIMAEGAGILVLESMEHALGRKAKILAEIIGYGNTSDAYHETAPSGIGAVRAMRLALKDAGIDPWQIDYINTHGTSTGEDGGDGPELDALIEVFGDYLMEISISSTKSATGHLLGAGAGLEAAICLKVIEKGIVPPTLNLHNPIRKGLDLVPLKARRRSVEVAMSNSFGFGGVNSVLVFKKYHANT